MKSDSEIRHEIFSILSDLAPELESESFLEMNANLRDQVDLDSMDFLNLITGVCERFKINIPEKDYAKLVTFNDFVRYVSNLNTAGSREA